MAVGLQYHCQPLADCEALHVLVANSFQGNTPSPLLTTAVIISPLKLVSIYKTTRQLKTNTSHLIHKLFIILCVYF